MNNFLTPYGYSPQYNSHDPFRDMQNQTAAQNAISSHYESGKRLQENHKKFINDQNIDLIRNQLSGFSISPLSKSLEITATMPLQHLPAKAQNFVRSSASALGVSVEMIAISLLGATFIAARGNFKIKINENWSEILTGIILAAAPSGERKSAVVELMSQPIKQFEEDLKKFFNNSGQRSEPKVLQQTLKRMEADLAKQFQKAIQAGCSLDQAKSDLDSQFLAIDQLRVSSQKSVSVPRILIDTPTMEALAVELERQDEAIGMFEAEGGFWKLRLKPAADDILLKSYTGESFISDTKTNGNVCLQSPVLAICSLLQPDILHKVYDNVELAGHGATARLLPAFLPSRQGFQNDCISDISVEALDWYKELIRCLLEIKRPVPLSMTDKRSFHVLSLSTAANARIHQYSSKINRDIGYGFFEKYPAFGAKLAGHAVRLAGAIHLMTHPEPQIADINESSMEAGILWAEFFRIHAAAAFTPEARDGITYAKKIFDWMKRHHLNISDEREVQRGVGHCSIVQTRAGIDELERHNFLRSHYVGTKRLCIVHPSAYNFFY